MATEKDIYELSDEELLNMDPSLIEDAEPAPAEDPEEEAPAEEEPASEEEDPEEEAEAEGLEADDGEKEEDGEEEEEEAEPEKDPDEKSEKEEDKAETKESGEPDYKAAYEQLMAPFKANGKEMKVDSVDDAITLMQMGANYNKKMAALKPNLKLMKMLENNNLLDANKLSYLIDLEKKDPAAIQKLVEDSGIDPLEMEEGKSEYKPGTYTVDDREIDLDRVLDDIQDTPTYQRTIDVVSNKWDGPSKQAIADTPQLLEVVNTHMANGVYDVISTEVEKQRALGRLNGKSDLEAYYEVGGQLNERGGFDHLGLKGPKPKAESRREVTPAEPKAKDPARSNKRRAASPTRTDASTKKANADFNPLSLSDEEFEKQTNAKFM